MGKEIHLATVMDSFMRQFGSVIIPSYSIKQFWAKQKKLYIYFLKSVYSEL